MIFNPPEKKAAGTSIVPGTPPAPTGKAEVIGIFPEGLSVRIEDREHFLPYRKYPWFKDASIGEIADVQMLRHNHLYWPELDINILL